MKYNFFTKTFGQKWAYKVIGVLCLSGVLILLPIFYFYDEIKFNPASFVQEWIRTTVNLFIIFFIVEYQKYISETNKKKAACSDFFEHQLLKPLNDILHFLDRKDFEDFDIGLFKNMCREFFEKVKNIDMYSFNIDFSDENVYTFKVYYQINSLKNYFDNIDTNILKHRVMN